VLLLSLTILLGVAAVTDARWHRIPNVLTLAGASIGLLLGAWGGLGDLAAAVLGLCTGLALLLPFYLLGGMGAGDVKLMAAVGAFLGPKMTVLAVAGTLLAGGVLALAVLLTRRGGIPTMRRYGAMLRMLAYGLPSYVPPAPCEPAAIRFPYAVAIATGTLGALWYAGELQRLGGVFA
jgi:prepilin peptidase CpaA